ncbi:Xyloglucan endotransglucosylase/hydrolase [Quillaja saponaria]|uniref:Xyloglucan endotransglucosylase/hydrolase n=1 Tax=Quillaja saponaria TaxID=32244 RepID=A0AAD7LXE1_QUISA|nr:Xyloglucan endotransglucosylase/hydrolase [Quillaja saponaria]
MSYSRTTHSISVFPLLCLFLASLRVGSAGNFYQDFDITWGGNHAQVLDGGQGLSLSIDQASGSGILSKKEYLFGRFDMQLKLIPGNSAGLVTTFYLSSEGPTHDEVDFEFLGSVNGQPYIIHTNIYCQGIGGREQQFHLWFDPTKDFHTYSIVWNRQRIIFFVDNVPIRVFNNLQHLGVPFPTNQPMRVYSSLWNNEGWAAKGIRTDWSKAPYTAYYRNFNADLNPKGLWVNQGIDVKAHNRIRWVQKKFMVYNYCRDYVRYPKGHRPRECKRVRSQ